VSFIHNDSNLKVYPKHDDCRLND